MAEQGFPVPHPRAALSTFLPTLHPQPEAKHLRLPKSNFQSVSLNNSLNTPDAVLTCVC